MALKANGKLVSTITFGNRRRKSETLSVNETSGSTANASARVQPTNAGRITGLLPGTKVYVHDGVNFPTKVGTIEKITGSQPFAGVISSRRFGYRSHDVPSVSVPVSSLGKIVPLNQYDSGNQKRNYRMTTTPYQQRQGLRIKPVIDSVVFGSKVATQNPRLLLGSATIGVGYVPQNQGPNPGGGDPKPVRRWPRDWHGDNMHN